MKRYLLSAALGAIVLLGTTSCGSFRDMVRTVDTISEGAGKIHRYQEVKSIKFSEADEFYIGRRVLANFFASYAPLFDRQLTDYVGSIGHTLAAVSQRPDVWAGYRFIVFNSKSIAAFCMPGGFVLVSTGMLQLCDNEDQLAAVLGHELGHARWRHPLEALKAKMESDAKSDLVGFLANRSGSGMLMLFSAAAMINWEHQLNSYSRTQELDADVYSCWLMMKTGYNPREMSKILKKLPGGRSKYSKLHPSIDRRLEVVREEIARYPKIPARATARTERYKAMVLDYLAARSMGEVEYDGGSYRDTQGEVGPDASTITK